MVECGVFVGCQCSHICVLPCTLCPPFCCCLYILYVIASLYICNCLCLCVYPLHVVCTYCMKNFLCLCNCLCLCTCFCAIIPSTTLHVFVCTPSQMVTLCLFWCPVNTRTLDDSFFLSLGYKCRSRRRQNTVYSVACCRARTRPLSVSAML